VPARKFTNEKEQEEDNKTFILLGSDEKREDEFRAFGIVGDINEEKSGEAIYSLMHFHRSRMSEQLSDPDDPDSEVVQGLTANGICFIDTRRIRRRNVCNL
jgi:hypothetical protein